MIEPEERDHWSDLAEELGLPPAPVATPKPISAATQAQRPAVAEPVEETKTPIPSPSSPELGEGAEEEPPVRGRRRRSAPAAEAPPPLSPQGGEEGEAEAVLPEENVEPAEETSSGEERPRRRRRTRGSKKSRKPAAAETEEAADEDRPRRRRRRRGKKADKESEAAPTVRREEGPVEAAPEEGPILDEEEDEDTEDFSTWNVPSWAEIIAGLYRPEH